MEISRRTRHHTRDTSVGTVLVGDVGEPAPQFPPADFYLGAAPGEALLGPEGILYSYTVVHDSKGGSYALAMVDFEPGVRVFGRLLARSVQSSIGSRVRIVAHALPDEPEDYAFKTVEDQHA